MFIGPDVNPDTLHVFERTGDDAAALAFFEAITEEEWTEIEEIESYGDLGDVSEVATFASVKDRRMRKFKTTRDAGTMTVVTGRDPHDDGQDALDAAERTDFNYAFKVIYSDARTADHTNTIEYFGGIVLSRPTNLGGVQDITKKTYNIGVNSAIWEDPSTPGS
jgi:hypothetical protein